MTSPGAASPPLSRHHAGSRDAILRLAAGRPWDFLGPAFRFLQERPDDHEVRLLAALHLTELRLRTAALESLEALPSEIRSTTEAAQIESAARRLPGDEIGVETRLATCRRNLDALAERAGPLPARFEEWAAARARTTRVFRAGDGNLVTREGTPDDAHSRWRFLKDARDEAARISPPAPPQSSPHIPPVFVHVEGTPWTLERLLKAPLPDASGYTPSLTVLADEPGAILDAFSLLDLSAHLADPRVRLIVGADALRKDLDARIACAVEGPVFPQRSHFASVVALAAASQREEHTRLANRVSAMYAGRDRSWWRNRFGAIARPRVSILSCRYTTFVRHSMDDLAHALRDTGCDVRVLIEPDAHSRLTTVAYLREIAEHEPDLIVVANYRKSDLKIPGTENIPWVCWVQDAMPHLFTDDPSDASLCFLAGLHAGRMGASSARLARAPIPVSERKFHPGPVAADLRAQLECEVAYVSHQSEPVSALLDRLTLRLEFERTRAREMLSRVEDDIRPLLAKGVCHWSRELHAVATRRLTELAGRAPTVQAAARFATAIAQPIADRMFRHETLEWAAEICVRRGWRFHLYGAGWDRHPRLAAYARPALEHGEELRAAYQAAAIHLHASVTTMTHQRVFECALSGGLPLSRRIYDCMLSSEEAAIAATLRRRFPRGFPSRSFPETIDIADSPELLLLTAARQRLRWPATPAMVAVRPELERRIRNGETPEFTRSAAWLLGDLFSTTFHAAQILERRLEECIEHPHHRESIAAVVRERALASVAYRGFGEQLLRSLADSLGEPTHGGEPCS